MGEFFDLEDFARRRDFLAKVDTYQLYFNRERPDSHKGNYEALANHREPGSSLALFELCLLPPVLGNDYFNFSGDTMWLGSLGEFPTPRGDFRPIQEC
jgi:hypothetical protein